LTSENNKHYFLTEVEALFFTALCSLMVPSGKDPTISPGAVEVGGVNYIDSTLFDFPKGVQEYFRGIVKLINEKSQERFHKDFPSLEPSDQEFVLKSFFSDPLTRERAFDLRSIALESFYSDYHDPSYHGITAWGAIQFEGKRISGIKKDWSFLKIWRDSGQQSR
jgi:Gluconate 2-dehydrogenase subunit 3